MVNVANILIAHTLIDLITARFRFCSRLVLFDSCPVHIKGAQRFR